MDDFEVPFMPYDEIREQADNFLSEHDPDHSIPIEIEWIAENSLGIDIVPVPSLHLSLDTDGYITGDLNEIHVEEYVYSNRLPRYRFTLAHEIGHAILHSDLYDHVHFDTIDGWKSFVGNFPERFRVRYETQAYHFAGLVLVPLNDLLEQVELCFHQIQLGGIDPTSNQSSVWPTVITVLADKFFVSRDVIQKRLDFDNVPRRLQAGSHHLR